MPVSRVSYWYPGPRESVHIKLLVSPVSFSHNNVYTSTHGLSSLRKVCLPCDFPFPRLSLYGVRRTDGRTDGQTCSADGQTDELSTTVTLAAHAHEG